MVHLLIDFVYRCKSQIATMMSMADGCIELYSGNDDQVLPILSLGGLGVISVLSNVAPKETHDMVMKFC